MTRVSIELHLQTLRLIHIVITAAAVANFIRPPFPNKVVWVDRLFVPSSRRSVLRASS